MLFNWTLNRHGVYGDNSGSGKQQGKHLSPHLRTSQGQDGIMGNEPWAEPGNGWIQHAAGLLVTVEVPHENEYGPTKRFSSY